MACTDNSVKLRDTFPIMENEMERTTGSDMDSGNVVEGFIWIRVSKKLGALLWGVPRMEVTGFLLYPEILYPDPLKDPKNGTPPI